MPPPPPSALAEKLRAWAAAELSLPSLPPPAVLRELTGPPRAAALFASLTSHARAPPHVAAARNAAALRCCEEDEDTGGEVERVLREIAEAEAEARTVEEEVLGLCAAAERCAGAEGERDGEGNAVLARDAVRAVQAAYAEAVRREGEVVGGACGVLRGVREVAFGGEGRGVEQDALAMLAAVEAAARALDGAANDHVERALGEFEAVGSAKDLVRVLEVLTAVAEDEARVTRRREGDEEVGKEGGEGGDRDGDVMRELQRYYMEMFIAAEDAACDCRKAELQLEGALQGGASREAVLLAELAGEHAAIAELQRLESAITMCRAEETARRDVEVERARALAAAADAAEVGLVQRERILGRVCAEKKRLARELRRLEKRYAELLGEALPGLTEAALGAATERLGLARERVERLEGLCLERDRRYLENGVWRRCAEDVDGLQMPTSSGEEAVEDLRPEDAVRVLQELALGIDRKTAYRDALQRELERDAAVSRSLASRAALVADAFERDRAAQDAVLCPLLDESISAMRDCSTRLVPAAMSDLRVWLDQPVRKAAPWLSVNGMSLRDYELRVVQRTSEHDARANLRQT